jgi:hypothetical protein
MPKDYHSSQSLINALRDWNGKHWEDAAKILRRPDGTRFHSGEELELFFQQLVDLGHLVMPIGKCNNFDPVHGCRGHDPREPNC